MLKTQDNKPVRKRYDVVVIGAGSGGLTAAVGLSTLGKSVALIEARDVGGDCTNVGCIPSKALIHEGQQLVRAKTMFPQAESSNTTSAGEVLSEATAANVDLQGAASDALTRVRAKRDGLRIDETHEFGSMEGIDLIFARAEIDSPASVLLHSSDNGEPSTQSVSAPNIVIATGSKPRRIPIEGLPDDRYLTNENFFEQVSTPTHLVIVGGGPVGLEMAAAARDLGSQVTLLEAAPCLLEALPASASSTIQTSLEQSGVEVRLDSTAKRFDPSTQTLHVGPLEGAATETVSDVTAVLVAIGRVPNSKTLGLDEVGIKTEQGFVATDHKGRTNIGSVWAVGDVTRRSHTTHGANAWGRRVVKAIAFPYLPASSKPIIPTAIFTRPEVASIGQHSVSVSDDVNRLTLDLATIDRSYVEDVEAGVIVVDVRRFTGKVLAATIVGPRAGELIGVFAMAMSNDIPLHKWYSVVWAYPTYSGAIGKIVDMHMAETLTNWRMESRRWLGGLVARRWG